jgi:hypothetical protein|tara:strand:+ start:309 stop:692 length:384 start_codon:yes stop_codon:yes gene_type:complete
MSAFYKSISLDQIIHVDKINDLTQEQQTVLRDELKIAVDEMLFMERRVKSEAPSLQNNTWLHKVNKKINICNQFLRILDVQKDQKISYKSKYEDTFSNLLIKKLGKTTYEAIQQKAHMLTISELMEQ